MSRQYDGGDAVSRVPCVPWNVSALVRVTRRAHGLVCTFRDARAGEAPSAMRLRVAVEMSGHLRTYRNCAASLRENLLAPNYARLFVATYPDVGFKQFAVRVQRRDAAVDVPEGRALSGEHLAALYLLDLPTVTARLRRDFPRLFGDTQWSWMIYQLFTMDAAHRLTAPAAGETEIAGPLSHSNESSAPAAGFGEFDVVVRVRPDLYVLGTVRLLWHGAAAALFAMECGGDVFELPFNRTTLLRAPHHPRLVWDKDPLSDHSAIGFATPMAHFVTLYDAARAMPPAMQRRLVFRDGSSAEGIAAWHARRAGLQTLTAVGWHVLLRDERTFGIRGSTGHSSHRREVLTRLIFGVTDPSAVGCPAANGTMAWMGRQRGAKRKAKVKRSG
jgi:hypothetical protein